MNPHPPRRWRDLGFVLLALVVGFGMLLVGFELFFQRYPSFSEPYPRAL